MTFKRSQYIYFFSPQKKLSLLVCGEKRVHNTYFFLKQISKISPLPKIKADYQASSAHHQFNENMSRTKEIPFQVNFQPRVFIIAITNQS